MKRFVIWALSAFSLCCCSPSEDVSEEVALQAIAKRKDETCLERYESEVRDSFLVIANAVLQANKLTPEAIEQKNKLLTERICTHFHQIQVAAGRELGASPCMLQSEDLPEEMPRIYKEQILVTEHAGDLQERYDVVQKVFDSWHEAQQKVIDNLCRQLVPAHSFGLLYGGSDSPEVDNWIQLPRSQRKARLHVASLLQELLRNIRYYRDTFDELFAQAYAGEPDRWDYRDYRRFRLLARVNLSIDEMLSMLYTEIHPAPTLEYTLPEHLRLSQLDFLGDDSVDSFVENIHQSLLRAYSYDESDEYKSAEEVRKEVEEELACSMRLMKIAYKAQLELIREMMPLRTFYGSFPEPEVCDEYDQNVQMIESIFLDDIRFVRYYAEWIDSVSGDEENEEFSMPSPAPDFVTPGFMIEGTPSEGLATEMYRMAGDAQRTYVRKVFHKMCDEGYDMTMGIAVPSESPNAEFQLKYVKTCMDDAEYAWERYAASLRELIEPHLSLYRGSGTGNMISGYMSKLFENHYNFYSSLLRISTDK